MDISMTDLLIPPLQNQSSNIAAVPNICGICSMPHYTGLCNALSDKIIPDKPHTDNLSRYSVPDGLIIMDCEELRTSMVITAQKFAKGTRFGPLLAPKSYVPPSRPNKFPLVIFNEIWHGDPFIDDLSDDIKELFNVRNYYLDTSDENKCNWMIHVDIARFSNEQNLMAYQENDQIYYTSTRDIELGDILKVWYSPSYASRMGVSLLESALNNSTLCMNVRQVAFSEYGGIMKMHTSMDDKDSDMTNNNYLAIAPTTTTSSPSSEISLPPVNSLMKNSAQSPNYTLDFDNLILMAKNDQIISNNGNNNGNNYHQVDFVENYQVTSNSDAEKMSSSPTPSIKQIKFTEMHESETQKYACELCSRKYITKSNLEKHMRSHDLFMCVVCMKMFQNPEELREHDCFKQKASAKKSLFHCGICWKVLSNSWSLNRHMKIHRNVAITPDTSSQEKSDDVSDDVMMINAAVSQNLMIQEPEMYTIESHCSEMSNDEKPILEAMPDDDLVGSFIPASDPLDVGGVHDWIEHQQPEFVNSFQIATPPPIQEFMQQMHDVDSRSPSHQAAMLQNNYDKCIVCARVFKNPNSLDKHLKNVHTAHVIRPELTTSIKKSSEYRRIVLNKKPIKENVAKALVSKLNKKNQQQNDLKSTQQSIVNDVSWNGSSLAPISSHNETLSTPVLENGNTIIIISNVEITPANSQTTAVSNGYTFANYQSQLPKLVPISGTSFKTTTTATIDQNSKESNTVTNNGSNHHQHSGIHQNSSPKVFIIDKVANNEASQNSHHITQKPIKSTTQLPSPAPTEEEHHQCPECEKVFQKKYQLKRHQEIHENLFYFCPFCKRAPVKARSSLRKHFLKDHPEQQDTWQVSNFMSTLLKKYEKIKKSSHESHGSKDAESTNHKKTAKEKKESSAKSKKKKEKIIMIESNNNNISSNDENSNRCEIINDQPLPQVTIIDGDDVTHQQQQIILSNLFLDPITLDEENNLIKYTLAGDDDFIMNGHNGVVDDGESSVNVMTHAGSIESYEMSEFSNFKSSFDEIQEKLDAELHEFNNDQMIKWSDELNDDSSSIISSQSASSDIGKALGKQKNGYMLT